MSVKTVTCVEVRCDKCNGVGHDEDSYGGPTHFRNLDDARESLTSETNGPWRITPLPDGSEEWLCARCALKADCARDGHQRAEWQDPVREHYLCDHCGSWYPVEWVERTLAGLQTLPEVPQPAGER
jgi:hypothetical protein